MSQTAIFGPFFGMLALTLAVWLFMFTRRVPFILSHGDVDFSLPGELARLSPASVSNSSDNLKNLFELPVLFYALSLYLFATSQVDATYVAGAWVFFTFRVCHSVIHCSFNHVNARFSVYLVAALALWFMSVRAALAHFGG
jgi:hypothetical protein